MSVEIFYWRGQRITELSRQELEAAFVYVARELAKLNSPIMIEARYLGQAEQLKRGR